MSKGKRVTIPENTLKDLAKMAKPFESPEDCIKRILSCKGVKKEMNEQEKDDVAAKEDSK